MSSARAFDPDARRTALQAQLEQAQQQLARGQAHVARWSEIVVRLDAQLMLLNELDPPVTGG